VHELLVHAVELNRTGKWSEAAALAHRAFERADRPTRCEAAVIEAYARSLSGEAAVAAKLLTGFDQSCSDLPSAHWARRERQRIADRIKPEDGFWKKVSPESLGLNTSAILEHQRLCKATGADSCVVVYRGVIVSEWYSANYAPPVMAMSSTKSITGLLIGLLVEDGKLDIEQTVSQYLPEWSGGLRDRVTIRNLMTHTAGFVRMFRDGVGYQGDKDSFVLQMTPSFAPGTKFEYSNEGVQMLSPLLDRVAGEPIQDYARRRLFEPLGMNHTKLHLDVRGHAWTYADMETTPRDMARIGLLMLQHGRWKQRPLISEAWVAKSTKPSQTLNQGYGLLWWLYRSPDGFAALGYLDTNIYVFPSRDLVVVRTQSRPHSAAADYTSKALAMFERFMSRPRATPNPLSPSLFKGDTGMALATIELEHPEWAALPLFESEGPTH
jgi:CubicO group peptidase (beta-lactamase class C family)